MKSNLHASIQVAAQSAARRKQKLPVTQERPNGITIVNLPNGAKRTYVSIEWATVEQMQIIAKGEGWDEVRKNRWQVDFVYGDDLSPATIWKARCLIAKKFRHIDITNPLWIEGVRHLGQ
jgi:hypothetical protein